MTKIKNHVSDEMNAGRLLSHGQITDLTNGFTREGNLSFSLFIVPVANVSAGIISTPDNAGLLVDCICDQDDVSSDLPVLFNQWTEAAILEIAANAIDLVTYNVYWAAGQ